MGCGGSAPRRSPDRSAATQGNRVLIVLDELRRVRDETGDVLVSGHWWRPGRGHDVIRIHFRRGGPSDVGGTILPTELDEDSRTLVWFRPDPSQVGHPYPEGGVRQNGCFTIHE
jgi:hypothetical protein